jgi:hypothetical protein
MEIEFTVDVYGRPGELIEVHPERVGLAPRRVSVELRRVPLVQAIRQLVPGYGVTEKSIRAVMVELSIKTSPALDDPGLEMIDLDDVNRIVAEIQRAVRIRNGMAG